MSTVKVCDVTVSAKDLVGAMSSFTEPGSYYNVKVNKHYLYFGCLLLAFTRILQIIFVLFLSAVERRLGGPLFMLHHGSEFKVYV